MARAGTFNKMKPLHRSTIYAGQLLEWFDPDSRENYLAHLKRPEKRKLLEQFGWANLSTEDPVTYCFNSEGFRTAEFDIMYGEGISKVGEVLDLAVEFEIIKKSGSWFSYGETKLGQGRDAIKTLILDNPELMEELEAKIKNVLVTPTGQAEVLQD